MKVSDTLCLIFHWEVVTESLKHCQVCLFLTLCMKKQKSLLYINEVYMDLDGRHRHPVFYFMFCFWSWPLLLVGMRHILIIQVEISLIFHTGSFEGNMVQVTQQPEPSWEHVFKKAAHHLLRFVLRIWLWLACDGKADTVHCVQKCNIHTPHTMSRRLKRKCLISTKYRAVTCLVYN